MANAPSRGGQIHRNAQAKNKKAEGEDTVSLSSALKLKKKEGGMGGKSAACEAQPFRAQLAAG